jgi:predicted protein tyrosine phosphatase
MARSHAVALPAAAVLALTADEQELREKVRVYGYGEC